MSQHNPSEPKQDIEQALFSNKHFATIVEMFRAQDAIPIDVVAQQTGLSYKAAIKAARALAKYEVAVFKNGRVGHKSRIVIKMTEDVKRQVQEAVQARRIFESIIRNNDWVNSGHVDLEEAVIEQFTNRLGINSDKAFEYYKLAEMYCLAEALDSKKEPVSLAPEKSTLPLEVQAHIDALKRLTGATQVLLSFN
ncbi:hypothetical protein ACPV5O_24920 [Vibrio maritimus]|uniref:hypothetical protein n=1 Tax=Vibrio maritimus TaxID=990268 RepID=UPI00406912B9